MATGKLYMAPNTLGTDEWQHVIPTDVASIITAARNFAVEDLKNARRYLRKLDKQFPIDDSNFFIINKKRNPEELSKALQTLRNGENVIMLSDAGCAGVADPGAELASLAHENEIPVEPLVGPSSILLTVMASGFNGQAFRFSGYLPKDRKERNRFIKELEYTVKKTGETQLFMDTPFRNVHVLEDMYEVLEPETKICVACDLTSPTGFAMTVCVKDFDKLPAKIDKRPVMFALGR